MLRLTGGEFKGRGILTPPNLKTRPTRSKLRQALFNSLQGAIPGANVLDLFAGSGTLGFEALSRGAAHVTFVEHSRAALALMEKNASELAVTDRITIIGESLERSLRKLEPLAPFDLVLADPPYASEWAKKLPYELPWTRLLAIHGFFCLEWGPWRPQTGSTPDEVPCLVKVREKKYAESVLTTYRLKPGSA